MRWLPSSLFGRLVLAQIAYGLVVALAFVAIMELTHARFHLETTQRRALGWAGEIAARHRARLERAAAGEADDGTAAALLARLAEGNPGADFYLIARDGAILAASRALDRAIDLRVDPGPIRTLLARPDRLPVLMGDPAAPETSRVFSASPVGPTAAPTAWFVLLLRSAQAPAFLAAHASHRFSDSLALAAGVTVPALAIATVILFMILQPLRRISASIATLERGQGAEGASAVAPISPPVSELEQLSRHVDGMVRRVEELLRRLHDDDSKMREMFAHLSHDLRTPLAVLDGCLDALARKDERLETAERRRLLHAAAAQSHSLGRLVDSIFALAQLQRPDYQLVCEPFFIAEAAHDIALKFSARARDHGIALEVAGAGRHPQVHADVLLIERVLDNLIDNAIRHARGATHIAIALREIPGAVEVTVRDDGPGLPPPVAAAFAAGTPCALRFNRSTGGGAGLGLGIVCRILELHGSRLELLRGDGTGTAFRFALSLAAKDGEQNRRGQADAALHKRNTTEALTHFPPPKAPSAASVVTFVRSAFPHSHQCPGLHRSRRNVPLDHHLSEVLACPPSKRLCIPGSQTPAALPAARCSPPRSPHRPRPPTISPQPSSAARRRRICACATRASIRTMR